MVKKTSYHNTTDILIAPELAFAIPVVVGNTGVTAGDDGRKVIKAGTPLYASADILMNRETVMATAGGTVYGVARWDIDVTDGDTNATLLYAGYVDYLKLDTDVQGLVDGAKENLKVTFLKGAK